MPIITLTFPIIRLDFIDKALESLYRFTDRSKIRVIIVDQSIEGWKGEADMIIRQKNQGFATGANTGIVQALKWGTPYIAVVNDDTEFIYPTWLKDALEEFETAPNIIAVNPMCPKIPMWGYGHTQGEYLDLLPYKETFMPEDIKYLQNGDYDKEDIEKRWVEKYGPDNKISPAFPFTQRGVIDGFACWLAIFKREGLIEKGMFDERFVWGGGEDYDLMCRIYSCAWPIRRETCDPQFHRRAVSTMKSWVWHHWGKSKDESKTLDPKLFEGREGWNNLDDLWMQYCDPWGHNRETHKPLIRDPKVYIHTP